MTKLPPFVILPNCKIRDLQPGRPVHLGGSPYQLRLGWTVKEKIGMAIINPRALAVGNKSIIVGK